MDFWLNFKVLLDPFSQTWIVSGSKRHCPLSHSSTTLNELQALSVDETDHLRKCLDTQIDKFDKESTAETHLIKHVIELNNTTPHRQKSYRRSEIIHKFISEEVDLLLEKGYVSWSNSEWACP